MYEVLIECFFLLSLPLFLFTYRECPPLPVQTEKVAAVPAKSPSASSSVGLQFKEQLTLLMEKIYTTKPHYIRCLKPNDANTSDNYARPRVAEQLRYGGVLEAVRVARSGFPGRLSLFSPELSQFNPKL